MKLKFLCKIRPHILDWVGEQIRCIRCGKYASDIVNDKDNANGSRLENTG